MANEVKNAANAAQGADAANVEQLAGVIVNPEETNNNSENSGENAGAGSENTTTGKIKTVKQVIAELIAGGNKKIANIRVRSAKVTEKDNYVMVSLSLDKAIPGYAANSEGVFEKTEITTVFASSYSIASILKESDETAWAANQLISSPKGLEVILAGSRIDIIQEEVSGDELYKNPFSNSSAEGVALGHDTIINHVIKIELCAQAKKMLNMMAMSMMGLGM